MSIVQRHISNLSVFVLCTSLIYSPFLQQYVMFNGLKELLLVTFLLTSSIFLFLYDSRSNKLHFYLGCAAIFLLGMSLFSWDKLSTPGSYISVIIVVIIHLIHGEERFENFIKITLLITTLIAAVEFVTGQYLYVVTVYVNGREFLLDEKLFSGAYNFIRAKGIFEGPLTLAQFSVFTSILFFKRPHLVFLSCIAATLTASRMGIFVSISVLIVSIQFFELDGSVNQNVISRILHKYRSFIVFGIVTIFLIILISFGGDFMERLRSVIDFSDSDSNLLRLYFWAMAIDTFLSYDFYQILLGENGLYRELYSNNAESGWLTLLVDNGILGVTFYLMPCILLVFYGALQGRLILVFVASVYLVCNSTMTFYLSASGNVLYWYVLLKWLHEKRKLRKI